MLFGPSPMNVLYAVGDITTDGLLLNDYKGHFLFIVNDTIDNELCLRASFRMDINIYYNQLYNFTVNKTSSVSEIWGGRT